MNAKNSEMKGTQPVEVINSRSDVLHRNIGDFRYSDQPKSHNIVSTKPVNLILEQQKPRIIKESGLSTIMEERYDTEARTNENCGSVTSVNNSSNNSFVQKRLENISSTRTFPHEMSEIALKCQEKKTISVESFLAKLPSDIW